MVAKKIEAIYGLKLTKKELYDAIGGLDYDEDYFLSDLVSGLFRLHPNLDVPEIDIYHNYCCTFGTELEDAYIVGVNIDTIWRRVDRCNGCKDDRFCCESCLNATSSGSYPIKRIARELTTFTEDCICKNCGHCHLESVEKCTRCGSTSKGLDDELSHTSKELRTLERVLLSRSEVQKDPKFYFMVDDCLSCS